MAISLRHGFAYRFSWCLGFGTVEFERDDAICCKQQRFTLSHDGLMKQGKCDRFCHPNLLLSDDEMNE